ncbi:equilibrative nucleobase transporter 1-like [Clavelina lepadiformis]|uniref:equilibrative nucleobase transporter 1-like n=1 Tax=Clavelina lepadiformis TaxID=159417 RepID=UPI00404383F0
MRTIEVVSLITGCIEVVLFSGIIYGWPAYVHVLKEEGYFGENCIITSLATANTSPTNITSVAGMFTTLHSNEMALANVLHSFCEDQEKKLNLAFTLALSVFYVTVYFSGYIFDKFGTWVIRILAGVLLLAISSSVLAILIYPASICIAIAGNLLLISNIQLAYLSVKYRFFIIAIINGLFNSQLKPKNCISKSSLVTKTIPILPLQYFTLSAYIVFRSFLYSGNWGFIATAFPAEYYGKLFGLECFVECLVQLLQYPLLNLSLSTMQGDFTVANISLAILALATLIHPYAIFRKGTGVNRFHAEYEDAK